MSWGQSNGTRAAEAQRAHLTSSNLLSAASICVGGAFRCCTRGTGIESLAATRTTEPSLRNPEPTMGFEKVDGQRMVTLTDTPLITESLNVRMFVFLSFVFIMLHASKNLEVAGNQLDEGRHARNAGSHDRSSYDHNFQWHADLGLHTLRDDNHRPRARQHDRG